MLIAISGEGATAPARHLESVPIHALGHPIELKIKLSHPGPHSRSLKDPRTDQALLLHVRMPGEEATRTFELNPSRVDITGEITAPPSRVITLQPQQELDIELPLMRFFTDLRVCTGMFSLVVELNEDCSPPFLLGIELRPESIPPLVALAVDRTQDGWTREQALSRLDGLPRPPALVVDVEDDARAELLHQMNQKHAEGFLEAWNQEQRAPDVQAFFDKHRLVQGLTPRG